MAWKGTRLFDLIFKNSRVEKIKAPTDNTNAKILKTLDGLLCCDVEEGTDGRISKGIQSQLAV